MENLYGQGDIEKIQNIFNSTLKKSFLISVVCGLFIAAFGPYIIALLFGNQFQASYIPLLIMLPGFIISASYSAVGETLSSIGKVHIPFQIGIICVAMNIILNVTLIPFLGIIGAAIATCVTMIINFCITMIIIRRYLNKTRLFPL